MRIVRTILKFAPYIFTFQKGKYHKRTIIVIYPTQNDIQKLSKRNQSEHCFMVILRIQT